MIYDDSQILNIFTEVADEIQMKVSQGLSWSKTEGHKGQHQGDVDADIVGIDILTGYGLSVFSEESGYFNLRTDDDDGDYVIVIDPVDGSTNASRGIPFYCVSLCAVRDGELSVALVRNLHSGDTYSAISGHGSFKNGNKIVSSAQKDVSASVIGLNGHSKNYLGWAQYRAFGSAALELCMVGEGSLDGFIDLSNASLASWDIVGGVLICREAGAVVLEADSSVYTVKDLRTRTRIIAAGTLELAEQLYKNAWPDD